MPSCKSVSGTDETAATPASDPRQPVDAAGGLSGRRGLWLQHFLQGCLQGHGEFAYQTRARPERRIEQTQFVGHGRLEWPEHQP